MYIYTAYNLCIYSEIELPELFSAQGNPQVIVRRGRLDNIHPETTDGGNIILSPISFGVRFLIQNGCEITFDADSIVDESTIRALLLGFAMSLLLRQRGLLVLHGSSVVINNGVVGFIGGSGWGKSTLAETFRTQGYPILTDDVMPIQTNTEYPLVMPSFPQIKLWPETAAVLGHDPEKLTQVIPNLPKLAHRFIDGFSQESLPLKKIYILAKGSNHEIIPLSPQIAVLELIRHTRSTEWMTNIEFKKSNLQQCASLAKNVSISRFTRKPALADLIQLVQLVQADLSNSIVKVSQNQPHLNTIFCGRSHKC